MIKKPTISSSSCESTSRENGCMDCDSERMRDACDCDVTFPRGNRRGDLSFAVGRW